MTCLGAFKIRGRRLQRGTATGVMSIVGDGDAIDRVMRVALDDRGTAMHWADALIAYAGDCDTTDREMRCGYFHDMATVARRVVQADYVWHRFST